jgi:hypothetical protein
MIGSWFPLERSPHAGWAWEVVTTAGTTLASGVSADEQAAGWDCRIALFIARTEAGEQVTDIANLPNATFGGSWPATAPAAV